jgi:hypothetical protein
VGEEHIFVTSSSRRNIVAGRLRAVSPRISPRGYLDVTAPEQKQISPFDFVPGNDPPPLVPPGPGAGEWNSEPAKPQMILLARSARAYLSTPDPVTRYGEEATATFRHYFANTGEDFTIDLAKLLNEVPSVRENFQQLTNAAMAFANSCDCEQFVSAAALVGSITREESENWFLAVNNYSYYLSARIESTDGGTRSLNLTLSFWDRYDWDPGVTIPIPTPIGVIPVDQDTVGAFHRQGLAQEFSTVGKLSFAVLFDRGSQDEH